MKRFEEYQKEEKKAEPFPLDKSKAELYPFDRLDAYEIDIWCRAMENMINDMAEAIEKLQDRNILKNK